MTFQIENQPSADKPSTSSQRGSSPLKKISQGFKRYWFVAVPAILLNAGITLDHVIAKNNEAMFRVRMKEVVLEAMSASPAQDDAPLTETLQAHWVTTNEDGNLEGRISAIEPSPSSVIPIEKLDVTLLRQGRRIRNASTDFNGKFTLQDVDPGIYTLVASGQNGFLAYGVQVLPKLEAFDGLDENTNLDSQERKHAYYVAHFNVPQESVVVESLQIDAAAVPPEFDTLQRICNNYLPEPPAFEAGGGNREDTKAIEKATSIRNNFQHPLSADGSLEGRIQPISTGDGEAGKLSDMNIFLIRDDVELARVPVQENGKFKIEGVTRGVYSLVAAGKDGFAALSMELVDATAGATSSSGNHRPKAYYVSHREAAPKAPSLGIAIVTDPKDVQVIKQEVNRIADARRQNQFNPQGNQGAVPQSDFVQFSDGFSGGVPGGSSFPGGTGFPGGPGFQSAATGPVRGGLLRGGGGFGGGGRGGIAGLVALSLGITALATNDSPSNPPPQSNIQPIN